MKTSETLRYLANKSRNHIQAGILRELADEVQKKERFIAALPSLECPCCGDIAAWADSFTDGAPTGCGCGGQVSVDIESSDERVYITVDECQNPSCLENS